MNQKLPLIFLVGAVMNGQQRTPIEIDRPDQTETPAIVPKGMFQMESGFSYEKDKSDHAWVTPSALMKYGVNNHFELRLIVEHSDAEVSGDKAVGILPVFVGMKVKISAEEGIVPRTSLIGHVQIPDLASPGLKGEYYAPTFRFTMAHTLTDKICLGYNLGAEWDGFTSEPTVIYTLTTGLSLSEKWGTYTELYGFASQSEVASHNFNGGFTYLLDNDTVADVSGGLGLTQEAPDYFVALGFSFRL